MRLLIVSMMSLLVMATVLAQPANPIPILADDPLTVTLAAAAPVLLAYESAGDERIQLVATAQGEGEDAPDVVLELLTPSMQQMAYSDDTYTQTEDGLSMDRNPRIEAVRLAEAGTYFVRVDSFNGVSEGDVQVLLSIHTADETEITSSDGLTRIITKLDEDSTFRYTVELDAATDIRITARDISGTLDPIVRLRQRDGTIIAHNDDHGSADTSLNVFDARIADFQIVQADRYIIEVLDYLGRAGTVEIQIEMLLLN